MNKLAITEADLILAFRQGWKPCSECIEALLNTTENPRRDDFSISCSTVNAMSPSENESDNELMNDRSNYFSEDSNLPGSWVERDKLYGDVNGPFRLPPPWNPIPCPTENVMLLCVVADRPPATYSDCSCDGPVSACISPILSRDCSTQDECHHLWTASACFSPTPSSDCSKQNECHDLWAASACFSPTPSSDCSKQDECHDSWLDLTSFLPFSSCYCSNKEVYEDPWHASACCSPILSSDECHDSWLDLTSFLPFSSCYCSNKEVYEDPWHASACCSLILSKQFLSTSSQWVELIENKTKRGFQSLSNTSQCKRRRIFTDIH
eukprot:GHVL01044284.1.p1 GENE.GHVL01044284.1~~GHVL01044284.1.p1  ORF type:complete len:323 (-),score=38.01 GHVL01044284.1:70-1038(-)